jgi:hypothetical protein
MFAQLVFVDDGYIHEVSNKFINMTLEESPKAEYEYDYSQPEDDENEEEEYEEVDQNVYKILSIDIGIVHLGLSISIVNKDFTLREIIWVKLIDITYFNHRDGVTKETCPLYHDKSINDYLEHVFVLYEEFFTKCDFILLERQPPVGIVVVEQLIFGRYRHKSHLVHPCSMHKYFNIRDLDYEQRKDATEKICLENLKHADVRKDYNSYTRKHDIADSICLMLFWLHKQNKAYLEYKEKNRVRSMELVYRNSKLSLNEYFEQFKYFG